MNTDKMLTFKDASETVCPYCARKWEQFNGQCVEVCVRKVDGSRNV